MSESVTYSHLVFTLPHALNTLIGAAPRRLYEHLFATASATLTEFAASPRHLGGMPAFSLVLHTWKQDLGRHVHVHALVAGGALSDSGEWIRPKKGFLFPVQALSKVFRGKFIAGLDDLRRQGHLPDFLEPSACQCLKQGLYAHDWVVYAKQPLGGPQAVLDYLGRYTHRVAISNERIIGIANDQVAFRVRADAEGKKRVLRLAGSEFIARFLLHVLPGGFKRIRHYGLLSPAGKKVGLAAARTALAVPPPEPAIIESVAAFLHRVARLASMRCPHCGGPFRVTATLLPQRGATARGPPWDMRTQPFLHSSQADGQAILGQVRPAHGQSTFWWGRQHLPASSFPLNLHPAMLGAHQSAALFHAMRLTSDCRSLQSP